MLKKLLTYIFIFILSFSDLVHATGGVEDMSMHVLDELPYALDESEIDSREALLEGDDEGIISLGEDSDLMPPEEYPQTARILYMSEEDTEDSFRTLLSEKRMFEMQDEVSFPAFIPSALTNTLFSMQPGIVPFLFTGAHQSSDIPSAPVMDIESSEGYDVSFPKIQKKDIFIQKKIRSQKKIDTMRGIVSVEMASGTIIRAQDGTIIDASLIQIASLESSKKLQAKSKYEKKMKNRGSVKKGKAEAQVEGFEFGLSGTHLIFSKPVMISIDTPNMSDGNSIDLLTLHAGDSDFHTGGLSIDPNTTCNSDGTATIGGSEVSVKNGKVTFYTCGASSFTMNPSGGTTGSNDLRLVIGDCAQTQIYYNGLTQVYTGNPPATGCSAGSNMDSWPVLRIGGTSYGNDFTAWTSNTTTGSTVGNTYSATSTMRATVGGLNYDLIIDWSHTAPNKYLTWSWRVIVPPTNTQNVRFYYGMDSYVAGADTNDVGYYSLTGGQTVGVYDATANVLSAFRYLSGMTWTAHQADGYAAVRAQIAAGADFTNNIQATTGDLGFGVDWDLGTTPATYSGTIEWRLAPYVSASVPDLIPGIGQPEGPLTTYMTSEMPITVSNVGNASSSGVHTVILTIPTNITGPTSSFTNNGWSCGAQVGTGVTCTKTTVLTAPTGEDTVRIPVTPTLAASGTNVTFNVAISNPGDSNITNNTAFAINAVVGGGPAGDPGGVAGERLWLRANTGTNCSVTGCTITTWANQGGVGAAANAVTGLGTATYDPTNRINGNPTIYMNGASFNTNNNLGLPTRANSIFAVTRIGAGGNFYMGTRTVTNNTRHWRTSPTSDTWMRYNSTIFYSGANLRAANTPAITSTIRQAAGASAGYMNGRSVLTSATTTTFTVNNFGIGRVGNTNSTLTNLAEVIIYNTAITAAQQKQVESYLSIKYGITLDQTTANNYVYSNGSVVWNATTAGVYKNNITGIGRDDSSTLNQLRSQSVTNTGDIIVAKSFITTNRHALLWGHDAVQTTTWTGSDAPFGFHRIGREWQFQEKNGDMGTITLSYPIASVPAGFTGTLMLLTDSDGLFTTGSTAYTGVLNGSNWDFSLNIADMQYITFAKSVPTDTTPPSITSINIASGSLIPTSDFTLMIGYADTGSSISTSSFIGEVYAWDSTGATWSAIDIAPSYMSITGTTTTSTGQLRIANLPYGKYRFDIIIADTLGNTLTQSYTYYVDAVEWTISAPLYPIGSAPFGSDTFGSGELIVTIRTVGAGFDLSMLRTADLTYVTDVIPVYSGSTGWGYDKNIGSGYSSAITPHGTNQNIVSIAKNINTNGQKNTFTYRVKYGVNPGANTPAGDYSGMVRFGINLTY